MSKKVKLLKIFWLNLILKIVEKVVTLPGGKQELFRFRVIILFLVKI